MAEYRDAQPHLFDTRPPNWRGGSSLTADADNEGVCTCCGARVTVGPDGDEYGHGYGCPHRLPISADRATIEHQISEHICPTCGRGDFESAYKLRCHHAGAHGEALREERTCDNCGGSFEPARERPQQYCSPACATAARRDRVTIECDHCGETFETIPSKKERGKRFCSNACKTAGLRSDVTNACEECGEEYEVKAWVADDSRFCSASCLGRANAAKYLNSDSGHGGVAGD